MCRFLGLTMLVTPCAAYGSQRMHVFGAGQRASGGMPCWIALGGRRLVWRILRGSMRADAYESISIPWDRNANWNACFLWASREPWEGWMVWERVSTSFVGRRGGCVGGCDAGGAVHIPSPKGFAIALGKPSRASGCSGRAVRVERGHSTYSTYNK